MNIDRLINRSGAGHAELIEQVHQIICNLHPAIQPLVKYGLPMYVMKKNVVYIDVQKSKPLIGIVYGVHMTEIHHLLDFTGRKQIGHFSLLDLNDQRMEDLYTVLYTAVDFDLKK